MTTSDNQVHALRVGDRAHRIVGAVLQEGPAPLRSMRTLALTRAASDVFRQYPVEHRTREAYFDAVTAAGVYLHRFRPPSSWCLVDTEMQVSGCRLDIVHRCDGIGVLIDELKLGVGRHGETLVQDQIKRYLAAGQELWGAEFIGVRLCAVHEPTQSRLYSNDVTKPQLVSESDYKELLGAQ
jgi:hypothetical protein